MSILIADDYVIVIYRKRRIKMSAIDYLRTLHKK